MEIVKFPAEHLSLLAEVRRHPDLQKLLDKRTNPQAPEDIAEWYGEVAAYVSVAVDGLYDARDFLNLARLLTDRLYEKRAIYVHIGPGDI